MKKLLAPIAVLLGLAACATTPPHSDQLDQARAQVLAFSQDPRAQQAAPDDLREAQDRLHQAEAALQDGKPMTTVDHLAYLAQRHADAGMARIQAVTAQQELASAQQQRQEIMLRGREREAQVQAEQAAGANEQLKRAQEELADLKAQQTDRGTVVTLGDVLFDTNAATLKPGADLSLDRLAAYLKEHPQAKVSIEGHTDSRGSDAYNEALSQRRADSVAQALIRRGVSADQVNAIGRGKEYPVATNDTPAGRQQNRRVEVVFSDNNGRFAQSGGSVDR